MTQLDKIYDKSQLEISRKNLCMSHCTCVCCLRKRGSTVTCVLSFMLRRKVGHQMHLVSATLPVARA